MNYLKTSIVSAQISLKLLTISHLAWAPTWRKPNLHKLMTSAENQELKITLDCFVSLMYSYLLVFICFADVHVVCAFIS